MRSHLAVIVVVSSSCGARRATAPPPASPSPMVATPTVSIPLDHHPETVRELRRRMTCDAVLVEVDGHGGDRWRDPLRAVCSVWRHVIELQADARRERDLIRLTCDTDKLAALEPVIDQALELGASDPPAISSELRRRIVELDRLAAESYTIDGAAAACVGEEAVQAPPPGGGGGTSSPAPGFSGFL